MSRFLLLSLALPLLSSSVYAQETTGVAGAGAGAGGAAVHFGARINTTQGVRQLLFNLGSGSTKATSSTIGSSLLTPGFDARGFQLFLTKPTKSSQSFFFRLTGSDMEFEGTVGGATKTASGQVITGSFGYQIPFSQASVTDSEVTFGLATGVTYRTLINDIAQGGNSGLREAVMGTGMKRELWSPEITLYINLGKDVQPYVQYTNFGGNLTGFSGGRTTLGVRALTDFFKKPPTEEPTQEEDTQAKDAKRSGTAQDATDSSIPLRAERVDKAGTTICYMDPKSGKCFLAEVQPIPFQGNQAGLLEAGQLNSTNVALQLRNNQPVTFKSGQNVFELRRKRAQYPDSSGKRMKF